ncbi:MAG: UvrD-helicase domain-containing protein [Rickettsiaceae bacterium]|nr:UvrD-helicase domain-containing protein [Rickettsiaceae bacterium]
MNQLQIRASNPKSSIWVSASAGTGKTKILTDRVLRLLLTGTSFSKILCLTFTNAAANEMQERIADKLSSWSTMSQEDLAGNLNNIFGRPAKDSEIVKAKKLYNNFLQSEDKVNIHTIHSFCQKILYKFPLEAEVSPNFNIIEETRSFEIIQEIQRKIYDYPELELINKFFTENFHELTIWQIFNDIFSEKINFKNRQTLPENIYAVSKQIIDRLNMNFSSRYQEILCQPLIQKLVDVNATIKQVKSFFLTKTGSQKKRIVSQKIAPPGSSLDCDLRQLQQQIYRLDQEQRMHHLYNYSELLNCLSQKIITSYENYKQQNNLLDYDDLIIKAKSLLTKVQEKQWVLYKLDGGIEHLLVDEAQDTSPMQWQIIEALIEEFYSGQSKEKQNRTIFVVGDEKQSIFSFQGANIDSFSQMNKLLQQRLSNSGKNFATINLETSYRSTKEIIDIVHLVFNKLKQKQTKLFLSEMPQISPFRDQHSGKVELWPLVIYENKQQQFWPINAKQSNNNSKVILAKQIAEFITREIATKRVIASTGKVISASDFMIIFRTRDQFTREVIKALKAEHLEVSGLDRIFLLQNVAVLDLLSVAKFVVNPNNDLNLACLLKSPIIGLEEEELKQIVINRNNLSIWQYLSNIYNKQHANNLYQDLYSKLAFFIQLANELNCANFFHILVDSLGYRQILNDNIGADSNDAINELLYISYNYANNSSLSLQNFIFWLEKYDLDIKRDIESIDKIKIMTAHGAKGLQSPIVILCDTTTIPTTSDRFIWDDDGKILSAKNANFLPEFYLDLKEKQRQKMLQEYLRLLYVAMTRAEDYLVICGYQNKNTIPDNCWYQLIKNAMDEVAALDEEQKLIYSLANHFKNHNTKPKTIKKLSQRAEEKNIMKNHYIKHTDYKFKKRAINYHAVSPLLAKDSLSYGLIFHKIMEDTVTLNDLSLLIKHPLIDSLDEYLQQKILLSINKIIANDAFTQLFKAEINTEVSFGVRIADSIKIGRIDLLVFYNNQIIIIDYKSDTKVPNNTKQIPNNYYTQLNFYKQTVAKIYPNKQIFCKILWLENGELMDVSHFDISSFSDNNSFLTSLV